MKKYIIGLIILLLVSSISIIYLLFFSRSKVEIIGDTNYINVPYVDLEVNLNRKGEYSYTIKDILTGEIIESNQIYTQKRNEIITINIKFFGTPKLLTVYDEKKEVIFSETLDNIDESLVESFEINEESFLILEDNAALEENLILNKNFKDSYNEYFLNDNKVTNAGDIEYQELHEGYNILTVEVKANNNYMQSEKSVIVYKDSENYLYGFSNEALNQGSLLFQVEKLTGWEIAKYTESNSLFQYKTEQGSCSVSLAPFEIEPGDSEIQLFKSSDQRLVFTVNRVSLSEKECMTKVSELFEGVKYIENYLYFSN